MEKLLTLTLSGAVTGALYSLVAAGLTLTYTSTGIFNFSYGAVAFVSAIVYFELNSGLHWPIVPAALVTILVFAPLLGLFLNAAVFRPLARAAESAKIMATVGLLIALPALTKFTIDLLVDTFDFSIPDTGDINQVGFPAGVGPVPRENWTLPGDVPFDSNQLIVFVAAAVCALALWFLLRKTRLGLQMRAVVDRPDLARTRGVNDARTSNYAWIIGMVLAAIAGVVGAPILGSLNANTYNNLVFVASAAAVLGGLRSVPLAFAGGLLLGVTQNLTFGYLTEVRERVQGFTGAVPFMLLLVGLLVTGATRARRGGSMSDIVPRPDYLADLPPWRRALPWVLATGFLVVYISWLADEFWIGIVANGLALSLVFLSFVIVTGLGGMVSLAQAAFVTAAGLTAGLLMARYDFPFLPALLVGMAVAVALGILTALTAIRLGGLQLALATLALAFICDQVLFVWNWYRNQQAGWRIERPALGSFDTDNTRTFALVLLVIVGLGVLLVRNLERSASGRSVISLRASEPAASTSGIAPVRTKLTLFAVSAGLAGFGGVMLATYNESVTNTTYPTTLGLLWLAQIVLFGIRRPGAAVVAGIVSAAGPAIIQSGFHWPWFIPTWLDWDGTTSAEIPAILFGLGAVQLARDPDGILTITAAQNHARRLRRKGRADHRAAVLDAERAETERAVVSAVARQEAELVETGVIRSHGLHEAPAAEGALTLRGVRSGYEHVEVLRGVDLVIERGRITALLGANGSGKSTLCSTVAGLLPVTSGTIVSEGDDPVGGLPAHERVRRGIVVTPESRGIFPGLSVEENLTIWLGTSAQRDQAYDRFPVLAQRRHLPAGNLSGGEQQMLALAPFLVDPPAVLIADEPTLGLAPLVVSGLMEVFSELRDRGTAILLVEEKARDVLDVADSVALLVLGLVEWQGPRADVDEHRLAEAYLGRLGA